MNFSKTSPPLKSASLLQNWTFLQIPTAPEELLRYFFHFEHFLLLFLWIGWSFCLCGLTYHLGQKKQNVEAALRYRIAFEKQITTISTNFINLSFEKIDWEIINALQLIGEFMQVNRSYIFLFLEQQTKMENTHEWCSEGVLPQINRLKALPVETFPYFLSYMQRFEIFYVPKIGDLPMEAHLEKTEFELEKIQSIICIPMVRNLELIGFLGFDSVHQARTWSEEDMVLLKILSEIFANALDRKTKEEELKRSLKEKGVLLKEVHHRVKNNLQIISSLLNLQVDSIHNEQTLEVFRESQNRVKSIALIHERLYHSENFAQIQFVSYVEKLVSDLCYCYQCQTISTQIDMEPFCLEMDIAIPCGLIINELVSNALKYAFPKKEGFLEIVLKQEKNNFLLKVADNGVGFLEKEKTYIPQTLGLQLVSMLVEQLKGTFEIFHQNGTTFLIHF